MAQCMMQNHTLTYLDLRGKAITSLSSVAQSWIDCLKVCLPAAQVMKHCPHRTRR